MTVSILGTTGHTAANSSADMTIARNETDPKGVLGICIDRTASDTTTSFTYGGASIPEITSGVTSASPVISTVTEGACISVFFLGTGVASGSQNGVFSFSGTSGRHGIVILFDAAADLEINDIDLLVDTITANPSASFALGSVESLVIEAWFSGRSSVGNVSPNTGWTEEAEWDLGAAVSGAYSYDTIGSSDVTCGYASASDDVTLVGIAINEVAGGSTTPKSVSATAGAVASHSKEATFYRSFSVAVVGASSLSRASEYYRSFSASPVGNASQLDEVTFSRALSAPASASASVATSSVFSNSGSATATGTASFSSASVIGRSFSVAAGAVATVVKEVQKTLSVSVTASPTLTRGLDLTRSFTASVTGSPTLQTLTDYYRAFTTTVTGTVVATATPVFGTALQFVANVTGTATLIKTVKKTLSSSVVADSTLAKYIKRTFTATATGTPSHEDAYVTAVAAAAVVNAVASAGQLFIEGVEAISTLVRNLTRNITRNITRVFKK